MMKIFLTETFLGSDQHKSEYFIPQLYNAIYPQGTIKSVLWNADTLKRKIASTITKREAFDSSDDGYRNLLKSVVENGLGMVRGVEATTNATEKFMTQVAPLMDSVFDRISIVSNEAFEHEDFAYTNVGLEAHNDNTYWNDPAGYYRFSDVISKIAFIYFRLEGFHVLFHDGEGGETLLVDGFNAATAIKKSEPEAFRILCTVPVPAEYIENGCHYTSTDSVLKLNPVNNELLQIRYNIRDRAVFNTIPQSEVGLFYDAYRLLGEEINKEENQFWIKLQPGTVLFVDNWRVLHGRSAFTGIRRFCSCYISRRDWTNKAKLLNVL